MLPNISELELRARQELHCRGCGGMKKKGLACCWTCFKEGPLPFKYVGLSFERWVTGMLRIRMGVSDGEIFTAYCPYCDHATDHEKDGQYRTCTVCSNSHKEKVAH